MFIKYDIKDFYTSISEQGLHKALALAKEFIKMKSEQVYIIKHSQKSALFHNNNIWQKSMDNSIFDVPQGLFEDVEVSGWMSKW